MTTPPPAVPPSVPFPPGQSPPGQSRPQVKIAPSMVGCRLGELEAEIRRLDAAGVDMYHWDIMDGHFLPNLPLGFFLIRAVREVTRAPFEVHLMVNDAERFIDLAVESGMDRICLHVETEPHAHRLLHKIRQAGCSPGLVVNPGTPLSVLEHLLPELDVLIIMTTNPGSGERIYLPSMIPKLRTAAALVAELGRPVDIVADGKIGLAELPEVVGAGANVVITGSKGVFADPRGYKPYMDDMRAMIDKTLG